MPARPFLSSTPSAPIQHPKTPGFDAAESSRIGITNLSILVSKNELSVLLAAYNDAIDNVLYCARGLCLVARS